MKRRFEVTLDLPRNVSVEEMPDYIRNEVRSGVGHFVPGDPLWNLDRESVSVKALPARTRKAPQ